MLCKAFLRDLFVHGDLDANDFAHHFLFFARRCLGKIPGGASFSQLHKGDKQSRVRP